MNTRLLLVPAILATTAALGASADTLVRPLDAQHSREPLGQHPAVLVAQQWSTRGIDPNTFIVAHPARLQLIAASETDEDRAAAGDAMTAE